MKNEIQKQGKQGPNPLTQLRKELFGMNAKFQSVLPPTVRPAQFCSVLLLTVQKTPDLLFVDRNSLFNEALLCAQDGLMPDGRDAVILKYNDKHKGSVASYQPMYRGMIKRARNSGEIDNIFAEVVHEHDEFSYGVDQDGYKFKWVPATDGKRGDKIKVFCWAKIKGSSSPCITVLTRDEVMAAKKVSKSAGSGMSPWNGDFEGEMWKKTAFKRAVKTLPVSAELKEFFNRDDDEHYDFNQGKTAAQEKADDLAKKLNAYEDAEVVHDPQVNVPNDFDDSIPDAGPMPGDPKIVK